MTSLITVEVQPQLDGGAGGDEGPRKIALSKNSFEGGDCMKESENCIFWPYEVSKANCSGNNMLLDIPGDNPHKDLVCRLKCIATVFEKMEDCEDSCPLKCLKIKDEIKCMQDPNKPQKEEK